MKFADALRTQSELHAHENDLKKADELIATLRSNAERVSKNGERKVLVCTGSLNRSLVRDIVRAKLEEDGFKVKIKYGFFHSSSPYIEIYW